MKVGITDPRSPAFRAFPRPGQSFAIFEFKSAVQAFTGLNYPLSLRPFDRFFNKRQMAVNILFTDPNRLRKIFCRHR